MRSVSDERAGELDAMRKLILFALLAVSALPETFEYRGTRWEKVSENLQGQDVWKFRDGPVTCYVLQARINMNSPSLSCVVPK